jgi:hypothetical protein
VLTTVTLTTVGNAVRAACRPDAEMAYGSCGVLAPSTVTRNVPASGT